MARKNPGDAPTFATNDNTIRNADGTWTEYVTQVREYKLITPLFGGGVEPGEADPVTVIRASEIRGHLRFWWRATRGGQFGGSLEKMKEAEDLLWGAASKKGYERPSLVQIEIESLSKPIPFEPIDQYGQSVSHVGMPKSRHSYATFPLNEKRGEVQTHISFRLTLRYPKQGDICGMVEDSLWAWETFGGLGGRTRRGLGAISLADVGQLPTVDEFSKAFAKKINGLVGEGEWHSDVPRLGTESWRYIFINSEQDKKWDNRLADHKQDEALAMWDLLLEKLRDFRQDRPKSGRKFGRSRWPEADVLRAQVKKWANYIDVKGEKHDHRNPSITLNGQLIKAIPRVVFGLPLIFQFKDNARTLASDARKYRDERRIPSSPRDPDPDAITIEGKTFSRWASPLILRPVQCSDGVLGIALVLHQPAIDVSQLRATGTTGMPIRIALTPSEASKVQMLKGQTDVLQSFLNYLKGQ